MGHQLSSTDAEQAKHRRAVEALGSVPWASGLVSEVRRPNPKPGALFELRFAYEIHQQGLIPIRPFRAGVGNTDIDFRLPGITSWNIELLSVNESDAITRARRTCDVGSLRVETLVLGTPLTDDPKGPGASCENDMRRMISKVAEKLWRDAAPIKFSVPDGTAVNMLLVDVRSFLGGSALIDDLDCRQIVFGSDGGVSEADLMWDESSGRPLQGIWDRRNNASYAACARERLHVIGFVHEESFDDDEIRQVTRLFMNPATSIDPTRNPLGWVGEPALSRCLLLRGGEQSCS